MHGDSAPNMTSRANGVEDARVAKDCRRQYTLPDVVRAENLRCFVNRKGHLMIEGPLGAEIIQRTNRKKVKFVPGKKWRHKWPGSDDIGH